MWRTVGPEPSSSQPLPRGFLVKVFVIVTAVALLVGGLVGGEMSGRLFSVTGAVAGGLAVPIILLSLGAYFTARDERKKEVLPPDVRKVFDRLLGRAEPPGDPSKGTSSWKPRPFHKSESKEDFDKWFAHTDPWARLDPRLIQLLIQRLYGNPMFEVFVHASQDCKLVHDYIPLRTLFDKGVGEFAACGQIARILTSAGANKGENFARLMRNQRADTEELSSLYGNAMNACEAAIHVEPAFLPAYLQLARLRQLVGKTQDAIGFCKTGLAQVERTKKYPLPRRPDLDLGGVADDVEAQLRSLLKHLEA